MPLNLVVDANILFSFFKRDSAKKTSPDIDDVAYFALALKLSCDIFFNTSELIEMP